MSDRQGPLLPKDLISVQEASAYLEVDETTLLRLVTERRVPGLHLDGAWLFSRKSLDKWRRQEQARRA